MVEYDNLYSAKSEIQADKTNKSNPQTPFFIKKIKLKNTYNYKLSGFLFN
jgi:hypothetical protein